MSFLDVATEYVTLFPAVVALGWIVLGFLFVVLREWRLPGDAGFTPTVAAVIPAHNEELLIAVAIESLLAQGLFVPAIRPPTVPPGTSRLRLAMSAGHTDEMVDALLTALAELGLR